MTLQVGFAPEEIQTSEPTRTARLTWVIVVDDSVSAGPGTNAAACVAAATAANVSGLLGPDAWDQAGTRHPGLPWAGCSVLAASAEQLRSIRERATAAEDVHVSDMPREAQLTRVYEDYRSALADIAPDAVDYIAVSLVGPRNRIDKLVRRLPLLP
jgi:hypothetical protein